MLPFAYKNHALPSRYVYPINIVSDKGKSEFRSRFCCPKLIPHLHPGEQSRTANRNTAMNFASDY